MLYVVNNNSAVDNLAQEGMNKQTSLHLEHPVPFLRLYSMESKIGTYMKKTSAQRDDALADSNAAAAFCDNFTDEPFLAELAMDQNGKDMKAAQEATHAEKARHRGISLESSAAQYFERHRDEFPELAEILQIRQQTDGVIDQDTRSTLKTLIRGLYTTFLGQFSGVIVMTPVAASNYLVHGSFKPDIVLVDEAGRLREMSLMIPMTWYDAPHIVVGDHLQFGPHLTVEHHVHNALQSENPFAPSITNSTLSRAVHAGKTLASLTVNHRQLGGLYQLPSQLFYYNQVQPFLSTPERWVPAVKAFAEYIMTLQGATNPSSGNDTSRLLVELPGSQSRKAGSSTYNSAHAEWVLDRVKEILNNRMITNRNGDLPAGILIIPLYAAQVSEYRLRIKKLLNAGKWTEDDAGRVKVCTLDGAQGHERDISIVDFTQTSEPGFTTDPRRLLVALTRGIIGEIIILNRGMFNTWDTGKRSTDAYMLHRVHSKIRAKAALRVVCCPVHETYRHKFDDEVCKTITAKPMGEDHKSCDDTTHSQGACPKRKCKGCGMIGHLANECRELHCSRCQETGHLSWDCTAKRRAKRTSPFLPVKTGVSKTTNDDSAFDRMTNLFQKGSFDALT